MPTPIFPVRMNEDDRQKLDHLSTVFNTNQSDILRHLVRVTFEYVAEREERPVSEKVVQS